MTIQAAGEGAGPRFQVSPIGSEDVAEVAAFLHTHLNSRVGVAAWTALMTPPWATAGPHRGFLLRSGSEVVGAYVAVHARRGEGESAVAVCNQAAFCVLPEFRSHSLMLVRAMTRQRGVVLTDLSPSGPVPALNERLGVHHLDVATRLAVNLPGRARGATVSDAPIDLERRLEGADAAVYRDHRAAAAARHLLVGNGGEYAYLVYRRDRRKRLPLFATPLYVGGNPALLQRAWGAVAAHLVSNGMPFTLAERRILGFTPVGPGRELASPRPRMAKGEPVPTDYLYSELALLPW